MWPSYFYMWPFFKRATFKSNRVTFKSNQVIIKSNRVTFKSNRVTIKSNSSQLKLTGSHLKITGTPLPLRTSISMTPQIVHICKYCRFISEYRRLFSDMFPQLAKNSCSWIKIKDSWEAAKKKKKYLMAGPLKMGVEKKFCRSLSSGGGGSSWVRPYWPCH